MRLPLPEQVKLVSQSKHQEWLSTTKYIYEWNLRLFDRNVGKLIVDPACHKSPAFGSSSQYIVSCLKFTHFRSFATSSLKCS
jgi:hypothetical protein